MTAPISHKKLAEFFGPISARKTTKEAGKSFSEEMQKRRVAASHSLPHFPHHRAKPQQITVGQAQKLAHFAPLIQDAARRHNIPVELICAVILQESGGNSRVVSPAGAKGLMQLMPATARRFGVTNSFDPRQNIEGGTRYLSWLLNRFNGNVELSLAGYNAGEGNVEKYGMRIPPFRETQNYVSSVLGYAVAMVNILRQPKIS